MLAQLARRNLLLAGGVLAGLAAALVPVGAAPAQSMPSAAGRVTYRISGPAKGSMVLVWTENGKKFRQDTTVTGPPMVPPGAQGAAKAKPMTLKTWVLSDGSSLYQSSPMGGKQVTRLKGIKGVAGASGAPVGLAQMLSQMGGMSGATKAGKATVLGQPCDVIASKGGKAWLWKGIPLRVEMQMSPQMPKTTIVATKVEKSPSLSPALFKLPAGSKVQDMDLSKMKMPQRP